MIDNVARKHTQTHTSLVEMSQGKYTHSPRSRSQIFSICSGWRYFRAVLSNSSISLVGDSMSAAQKSSECVRNRPPPPPQRNNIKKNPKNSLPPKKLYSFFSEAGVMPSREALRRDGTHDGTELSSFTTMCNELVLIFPFPHFFMGLKVGNVEQLTSAASPRPPSRSPCFLLLASLLSRVSTGVLEPCHALPANDGMQTAGQLNPGLTLTR